MRYLLLISILFCAACSNHKDDDSGPYCASQVPLEAETSDPTILVIGDSISIGYTPTIRASYFGAYQVVHNPCNAMTSTWTLSQLDTWLGSRTTFEAITFNNGLWDTRYGVSEDDYRSNLHLIAQKIKAKTAKPLFLTMTQILPGTEGNSNAKVLIYNQIAIDVMQAEGVPVFDLYTVSDSLKDEHTSSTDVHYTNFGYQVLGISIVNELSRLYGL